MAYVRQLPTTAKRQYGRGERPTWEWNGNQLKASDVWVVPWSDIPTFQRIVGGTIEDIGGIVERVVPLRFNEYESAVAVRMTCLTPEGSVSGTDTASAHWEYERIRVDYETPNYGEDYTSLTFAPHQRIEYKPAAVLSGLADDPINGLAYNLTYHKLASVPLDAWADIAGRINNATWKGYPAYHVKFDGPSGEQKQQFNGVVSYSPTLTFLVSRERWDYAYDATGAWVSKGVPAAIDFTSYFG
jgi:hypothetical protein